MNGNRSFTLLGYISGGFEGLGNVLRASMGQRSRLNLAKLSMGVLS